MDDFDFPHGSWAAADRRPTAPLTPRPDHRPTAPLTHRPDHRPTALLGPRFGWAEA